MNQIPISLTLITHLDDYPILELSYWFTSCTYPQFYVLAFRCLSLVHIVYHLLYDFHFLSPLLLVYRGFFERFGKSLDKAARWQGGFQ